MDRLGGLRRSSETGDGGLACIVSHRLGGYDGVSTEASKWSDALEVLGWSVIRAAGHFVGPTTSRDVLISGLWADSYGATPPPVDLSTIRRLCNIADLVVLDNVGSLWTAPNAAKAWERELLASHTPAIIRHHDPPWQLSPDTPHSGVCPLLPLHDPRMLHVTINRLTYNDFLSRWPELERSGSLKVCYNSVDTEKLGSGNRRKARTQMGISEDVVLVTHPARNIPRKRVDIGLSIAQTLNRPNRPAHYWLTDPIGPIERGQSTPSGRHVRIHRGYASSRADLYSAGDLIVLPSSWKGWGLPVIEAAAARRPIVAGPYEVLEEIRSAGLKVFSPDNLIEVESLLSDEDARRQVLDRNYAAVVEKFSKGTLPGQLADLVDQASHLV